MSDLLMLLLSLEDQMRGHTKDHYESYGCQGSHTTPPEEHLQDYQIATMSNHHPPSTLPLDTFVYCKNHYQYRYC
ncbi:hypothetical protein CFP56_004926 [Quercus suber]|uniref:Uncharacterized protein n=1 Tax=Quercus suber TaxID=58331 RepID=A0AAW0LCP0_QUESU